jgi:long-chain acyl-CoA synthetase
MTAVKETLVDVFWKQVAAEPERTAILHKLGDDYVPVTWAEQGKLVEMAAGGLMSLGVRQGDKVAILSHSRPHWTWADLAILSTGAVTVPIFPTAAPDEMHFLLEHSEAVGVFAQDIEQLTRLLGTGKPPAGLKFAVLFDRCESAGALPLRLWSWERLSEEGQSFLASHPGALKDRLVRIEPEDLATIVYTSGTTGVPKGAMLLHKNIHAACQAVSNHLAFCKDEDLAFCFLPLSHIYARINTQFMAIFDCVRLAYAESVETASANISQVRPTVVVAVPRFFEVIYSRIQAEVRRMPGLRRHISRWALSLVAEAGNTRGGRLEQILRRVELAIADRLVFRRIRQRLGGRVRMIISGGAPLLPNIQQFFTGIGLTVVEGYGLTETAAAITCNDPQAVRPGTVGKPLNGTEIRIADDGEILVRGPSVFAGYYRSEKETRQSLRDNWFLTGDLGELDQDGSLKITGRKKDIIVTASGKNVAPQRIESLFADEKLISKVVVYGDRHSYLTALITLKADELLAFGQANALGCSSVAELARHPLVRAEVERAVRARNKQLAGYEQIKRFHILEEDFTIEAGELTPTFKVKRQALAEKYKGLLEQLYVKTTA